MIPAFPQVCDALVASLRQVLGADVVFDGIPVQQVGAAGVAVGATREDTSSGFAARPSDLAGGISESLTITCLAWSGDGRTVFKPHRDAVGATMLAVIAVVDADRTLGGVVDTAEVTGGTWQQEQTGEGVLVTCEFQITVQTY